MKVKLHELKINTVHFNEIAVGRKKFEIRKNDRDFKIGDKIKLREYLGRDVIDVCTQIEICKNKSPIDCPFNRKECLAYNADVYTGNYILGTIIDVFDISDVITEYVAFNFVVEEKKLLVNKCESVVVK